MKILHIVSSLESSQGGPPNVVYSLAEVQKKLGHKVSIVGFMNEPLNIKKKFRVINGNFVISRFYIPNLSFIIKIYNSIKHSDIVHLHGVWNGVISISALLCRFQKKKVILTAHGSLDKFNIKNKAIFKKIYFNLIEQFNLNYIHGYHFLTLNEYKNSTWFKSIKDKKFLIQSNSINFDKISKIQFKGKKFQTKSTKTITFLGRLNKIKNINLQIDLIYNLIKKKNFFKLNIIGPDDGMLKILKKKVSTLNLEKYVTFKKPIYGKEKYYWLKKSDIIILTSFYECNSVTAIEAMTVGGVLLATKNCNLQEAANAGAAKISDYNVSDLIKSVNFLSIKKNSYMIRKKALNYAKKNLDINNSAMRILDFYELIKNKS
jgi:glycosyltransferase involved in cell wall biosynthesis